MEENAASYFPPELVNPRQNKSPFSSIDTKDAADLLQIEEHFLFVVVGGKHSTRAAQLLLEPESQSRHTTQDLAYRRAYLYCHHQLNSHAIHALPGVDNARDEDVIAYAKDDVEQLVECLQLARKKYVEAESPTDTKEGRNKSEPCAKYVAELMACLRASGLYIFHPKKI